jgi:hypothetical protein
VRRAAKRTENDGYYAHEAYEAAGERDQGAEREGSIDNE